jgi:hypothetical protein
VGLYIIGNGAEMEKNKDRFGRSLKELLSYSKEKRWFWKVLDQRMMDEVDRAAAQISIDNSAEGAPVNDGGSVKTQEAPVAQGAIAENEYTAATKTGLYGVHHVGVKLLVLSRCQDWHYLSVLSFYIATNCHLGPSDQVTINFGPNINSSDQH